jgi:hypothetical protein
MAYREPRRRGRGCCARGVNHAAHGWSSRNDRCHFDRGNGVRKRRTAPTRWSVTGCASDGPRTERASNSATGVNTFLAKLPTPGRQFPGNYDGPTRRRIFKMERAACQFAPVSCSATFVRPVSDPLQTDFLTGARPTRSLRRPAWVPIINHFRSIDRHDCQPPCTFGGRPDAGSRE